jgi:hypothetical protein
VSFEFAGSTVSDHLPIRGRFRLDRSGPDDDKAASDSPVARSETFLHAQRNGGYGFCSDPTMLALSIAKCILAPANSLESSASNVPISGSLSFDIRRRQETIKIARLIAVRRWATFSGAASLLVRTSLADPRSWLTSSVPWTGVASLKRFASSSDNFEG